MIIFRCNAGPEIGFGHISRCRALAKELRNRGEACVMVGPRSIFSSEGDRGVFDKWIPIDRWSSGEEDARMLLSLAGLTKATAAVLDDYRVEEGYQLALRAGGLPWLQFDPAPDKPVLADLVLCASPGATSDSYVLQNPATRLLLGPAYAILREEFANLHGRAASNRAANVLLTFGGGDDCGAITFVLSSLLAVTPGQLHFTVVSGEHNPNNQAVRAWIEGNGSDRVRFLVNPPSMATVMQECGVAVIAAGTTTFEAAFCGLPMVLVSTAENQVRQAQGWANTGAALYLGPFSQVTESDLRNAFLRAADRQKSAPMRDTAMKLVDGLGASRVADTICQMLS